MRRARPPARQAPALPLLCPPDVFGIVNPGVYRSNTFRSESYSFVKTLRLNTVVSFRAADVHNKKEADQLSQFLEAGEVQQIVLRIFLPIVRRTVKRIIRRVVQRVGQIIVEAHAVPTPDAGLVQVAVLGERGEGGRPW